MFAKPYHVSLLILQKHVILLLIETITPGESLDAQSWWDQLWLYAPFTVRSQCAACSQSPLDMTSSGRVRLLVGGSRLPSSWGWWGSQPGEGWDISPQWHAQMWASHCSCELSYSLKISPCHSSQRAMVSVCLFLSTEFYWKAAVLIKGSLSKTDCTIGHTSNLN